MNPSDTNSAALAAAQGPFAAPDATAQVARLRHLFRHSLAAGKVHPLQSVMWRYRGLGAPCDAALVDRQVRENRGQHG